MSWFSGRLVLLLRWLWARRGLLVPPLFGLLTAAWFAVGGRREGGALPPGSLPEREALSAAEAGERSPPGSSTERPADRDRDRDRDQVQVEVEVQEQEQDQDRDEHQGQVQFQFQVQVQELDHDQVQFQDQDRDQDQDQHQHQVQFQDQDRDRDQVQVQVQVEVQEQEQDQVQVQVQVQDQDWDQDQVQVQEQVQKQVQDQDHDHDHDRDRDQIQFQDQDRDQDQHQVQKQEQVQDQDQFQVEKQDRDQDQDQDQFQVEEQAQAQDHDQVQFQDQDRDQDRDQVQFQVEAQEQEKEQVRDQDQDQAQDQHQDQDQDQDQHQDQDQDQSDSQDQDEWDSPEYRVPTSDELHCAYDSTWDTEEPEEGGQEPSRRPAAFRHYKFSAFERAARDMQNYRHKYPFQTRRQHSRQPVSDDKPNLKFYLGETPSVPDGLLIDQFHTQWAGDYEKLERVHTFIQWLFPLQEPGVNYEASPLTAEEIQEFLQSRTAKTNLLKSYKLMLDFYGMELLDERTGEVQRSSKWEERFSNLNRNTHNNLRITRILKCQGELGYAHYQAPLVRFFLEETLVNKQLPNVRDSVLNYFVFAVLDRRQRRRLLRFAFLHYDRRDEFVWCPKKIQMKWLSEAAAQTHTDSEATSAGETDEEL